MSEVNNAESEGTLPDEPIDARTAQERLAAAFPSDKDPGATPEDRAGTVINLAQREDVLADQPPNPFGRAASTAHAARQVEALLFASPSPLPEAALAERVPGADIPAVLEMLSALYENRGVNLRAVAGGWQFVTAPDVAGVLVEHRTQQRKLSRAALETLAIIAYHQPCSRSDIEEVRGVAVGKGSLDQLLELGWIKMKGRREVPGRPVVYGTTPAFLEHFGLESLSHLPGAADLKAAGLLDARLPPGFEVPTPKGDPDGDDTDTDEGAPDTSEFTTDFQDEGDEDDHN